MADVAKFAVVLEDLFSGSAGKAKASVSALSSELTEGKTKLAAYQSQLSLAKELGDVAGYRKYSALVASSKQHVFGLAQQLEGASEGLASGAGGAAKFAAALGPIGAAAGVALAGVTALTVGIGALISKSLDESFEKRSWTSVFEAMGSKAGEGEKVNDMLGELAQRVPTSDKQLVEWTRHLQAMGVTDLGKIRSELIAMSSAQALALGDPAAASKYLALQERVQHAIEGTGKLKMADARVSKALVAAGVNESDVARRMGMSVTELGAGLKAGTIDAAKFGNALRTSVTEKGKGPLDVMMSGMGAITQKASEAFGNLFEDIDTTPLTDALRNLVALGDAGSPAGEGIKAGLVPAMNAVIKLVGSAITEAEVFFLDVEIGALQAYIALKPLISAVGKISDVMGSLSAKPAGAEGSGPSTFGQGAMAARATGESMVGGIAGPIGMIPGLMWDAVFAIGDAKAQEIARAGGVAVGKATIEGVRTGVDAHSPSVAAQKIGMDLGAGLGQGMTDSPAPDRAARTISASALGGLGGAGGMFGGADDNGSSVTVGSITIQITAPDGVTDAQALSVIGLSTALERFQIGAGR